MRESFKKFNGNQFHHSSEKDKHRGFRDAVRTDTLREKLFHHVEIEYVVTWQLDRPKEWVWTVLLNPSSLSCNVQKVRAVLCIRLCPDVKDMTRVELNETYEYYSGLVGLWKKGQADLIHSKAHLHSTYK